MQSPFDNTAGSPCSHQGGFSLIELMLGTVAVIVALGAVISACLQMNNVRKVDEDLNLAYMAAMSTLEDIRSVPFTDLVPLNGQGFDVPALNGTPGGLRPWPGDADGMAGKLVIKEVADNAETKLYLVTAKVEWLGRAGQRDFEMQTLVGERNFK